MSLTARRPSDAATDDTQTPPTKSHGRAKKSDGAKKQPAKVKARRGGARNPSSDAASVRLEPLTVGGEPRVDLLPPEVRAERRNARTRRAFSWAVLAVVLVVVLATAGVFSLNVLSQAQLLTARSETASLLAQQQLYAPAREVQKQVVLAKAAQQAGASTEIDWKAFLDKVGAAQPAALALTSVAVDSVSPLALYQQSTDPLQGPRIGTVTVVGSSATLPDVPAWVAQLQKIPGVVDVVPGTVTLDDVQHVYKSTVTIHLSESLYTNRFDTKAK